MLYSMIVVDDFYDDPHAVRARALSLSFRPRQQANYPGGEAHDADQSAVRDRIRALIPNDCDCPCPKQPPFMQGKFRLALAADAQTRPDGVHEDVQTWSAIIYLSLPEHCDGGVSFYRHRATRALNATPEWEEFVRKKRGVPEGMDCVEDIRRELRERSNWELIGQVPMQFNRLVILNAHCFHASAGIFGDAPASGRLTQHFEFYTLGDWMRYRGISRDVAAVT